MAWLGGQGRRRRLAAAAVVAAACGPWGGLAWVACAQAPGGPAQPAPAPSAPAGPLGPNGAAVPQAGAAYFYDHAGRRDPFAAVIQVGRPKGPENPSLPPLQRVSVSEINLIGIIWGAFGYTAMVQTPDGKGHLIKPGTRIGLNDGVVSAITESSIVVREEYSDVYGNKQVREHVKHLHPRQSPP